MKKRAILIVFILSGLLAVYSSRPLTDKTMQLYDSFTAFISNVSADSSTHPNQQSTRNESGPTVETSDTTTIDVVHAVSEEWRKFTDADGDGLYWYILREVYNPEGIKVKHGIYPYLRTVNMVQNNKADLFVASYYKEQPGVLYPDRRFYYDADHATVLYKKGTPFRGLQSLKGKKVGWVRGYSYEKYLDFDFEKVLFSKQIHGFRMLRNDRLDYMIEDVAVLNNYSEKKLKGLEYDGRIKLYLYFAFQDTPSGRKLLNIYQKNFPAVRKTEEFRQKFEKLDLEWLW
ncbi:MAG: substrate-binding periplasmic protein [bacterium]